jgi:hypothetical protein
MQKEAMPLLHALVATAPVLLFDATSDVDDVKVKNCSNNAEFEM